MNYGRDRRRRLTREEAIFLYTRANGHCEKCGIELGADWHAAHGIAWANGGATTVDQMQAQCMHCNLTNGTRDAIKLGIIELRQWQELAVPQLLEAIFRQGFATLHAAPGAGKTLCITVIFKHLYDLEIVKRLVVIVPNTAIVGQWKETLDRFQIHIDDTPRDNHIEHPQTVGLVSTYQSLREETAKAHAQDFKNIPSMLVFDEVHHLADKGQSWGKAAKIAAGDILQGELHAEVVLNSTGTLFRSGTSKRISTVKYKPLPDNKLQAIADYSIPTASLIGVDLRGVDVFVYNGKARLIDLRDEEEIVGEICDLEEQERKAVIRDAPTQPLWRAGFINEALKLHRQHLEAINYRLPLKILFVCPRRSHARLFADEINHILKEDFARLIISDEPRAMKELRRAKKTDRCLAYVTVNMISEGFDDPNISVIAYCSNVIAQLRIAQVMARGMRLTKLERELGQFLPTKILIPNVPELRKAFAAALASTEHIIEDDPVWPPPPPPPPPPPGMPRFKLIDLSDPRLNNATVLGHDDGDVPEQELTYYHPRMIKFGIPLTFDARVALIARDHISGNYRTYKKDDDGDVHRQEANPRDINKVLTAEIARLHRLMAVHVAHDPRFRDIGEFQSLGNDAAGIISGERGNAMSEQLTILSKWMDKRLQEHFAKYCKSEMPEYVGRANAEEDERV
jgi:superfamily II DNA or RNA helicase